MHFTKPKLNIYLEENFKINKINLFSLKINYV